MPVIADALKITPPAVFTATAATATSVLQTTAGGNLILNAPGSNRLLGKSFYVVASGYLSTSGGGTFTATLAPILYGDASLATVTTKPLFTSTAGTLAYTGTVGAAIPWSLWAELEGDSISGTFYGVAQSVVGATLKTQTITVAPVSSINFATEPPIKFAIGVTTVGTLASKVQLVTTEFYLFQE
jgi:hypothetical protein